ncbi:MAG: serine hydrolase domain-containing protein, partial [Planctomycetota bacterium]|nr:serine hydrolase domain-containing protein [Planctomycetota bacterium]
MRILLLFFLLSPAIGNAQSPQLSWGSAAEVGIDSRKLANAINLYRQAVQKDVVRGAVLLIARDAKVIALEALGWKNVRLKLPMQKDTLFRMASNTKPVIGAAIAYLFDRGKLQFHDPVGKVLESFQHPKSSDITIHQLLTHTSGFRIQPIFLPPPANPTPMNRQQPNLQIEVNRFAKVGATAKPGTSYSYSNAGFNTLGAVIEVVSQRPLEDFLRATIYQPLDMRDTYHHEIAKKLDGKLNRMSVVYTKRNGQWTVRWKPGQAPQYPFVRASGGLISTAWDYAV